MAFERFRRDLAAGPHPDDTFILLQLLRQSKIACTGYRAQRKTERLSRFSPLKGRGLGDLGVPHAIPGT